MAGATFGRKGMADTAPSGRRAQFIAPKAPVAANEAAARRDAFIAAERARSGTTAEADPMASAARAKEIGLPVFPGRKSVAVAYSLWFGLWAISAHRFYVKAWISGIAQTALWYVSLMFWMAGTKPAFYPLLAGLSWIAADLFLIPGMVRAHNERLQAEAEAKALGAKAGSESSETP